MSNVAGRTKSEPPVAHTTFLNKSANQSTSLYQQCAQLRARLLQIPDFTIYFDISCAQSRSTEKNTDPVTLLWDCFALGAPLCFLHNLMPGVNPISQVNTDPDMVDPEDGRAIKKAIVHFAMAISQTDLVDQNDQFRATQLLNRESTEGFVKVVHCVTRLVDRLPEDIFEEETAASPPLESSAQNTTDVVTHPSSPVGATGDPRESSRNNVIREIVFTERKYVQDLEHMQKYANHLVSTNAVSQDTVHLLFPGIGKLLDFQRRFLIKLESCMEMQWLDQRWGQPFIESEQEFSVYEPYCANYVHAVALMLQVEASLSIESMMTTQELPAFLIKPVQRICKYPLLLDSLLKAAVASEYPHYDELKQGWEAAKRSADRINEAQRRAENLQTVASLESRVEDWRGHHLANFGDLLLDDIFMVTKMDIDREYHVFLFEKIILCCKEASPLPASGSNKKVGKSNSILKKQSTAPLQYSGASGSSKKKDTPLLLKGRIFLNNVTRAIPSSANGNYSLQVWWSGDDDDEYFTLRCRNEEQLKQWETQINRLIRLNQQRRQTEHNDRNLAALAAHVSFQANSTNPAPTLRSYNSGFDAKPYNAPQFTHAQSFPAPGSSVTSSRISHPASARYPSEIRGYPSSIPNEAAYGAGPSGYPQDIADETEEEYEEYPPVAASAPRSGRGTPLGNRRGNVSQSLLPERDAVPGYDRPRARTEDTNGAIMRQWRKNGPPVPPQAPPPSGDLPTPIDQRPGMSRLSSNVSDASFGPTVQTRPPLRSQFSTTKLHSTYENGRSTPPVSNGVPPISRSRSASQPMAFHLPPPLPQSTWADRSQSSLGRTVETKRGSGSSQSTGGSSDYSPHTSPITPYGSSDSSLGGTLRNVRSQNFGQSNPVNADNIKVKVHFFEDIFVISVSRGTNYTELLERVGKKIRLCGPRREDGPLRVRYVDEDGDMVSLGSNEDVQMAFETVRQGSQVTLYVQ